MATTVNSVCMHRIDLKQQYHRDKVPLRSKEKNVCSREEVKSTVQLFCQRCII